MFFGFNLYSLAVARSSGCLRLANYDIFVRGLVSFPGVCNVQDLGKLLSYHGMSP